MNEFAEAIAAMIMWPLTIYVIYALVHKKRIYEDNLGHFGKVAAMSYAILMSIGIFFIFVGFLYGIVEIALNTSAIKNVNTWLMQGIGIAGILACHGITLLYSRVICKYAQCENQKQISRQMYTAGLGSVVMIFLMVFLIVFFIVGFIMSSDKDEYLDGLI